MALILTRRAGESVRIGKDIIMTVREIHPREIRIHVDRDGFNIDQWVPLYAGYLLYDQKVDINVSGISGNQVRLAFDADKSVKIVRSELLK